MSLSAKDSELVVSEAPASSETVRPLTFNVTVPDVPPPDKPVPAVTPVISPAASADEPPEPSTVKPVPPSSVISNTLSKRVALFAVALSPPVFATFALKYFVVPAAKLYVVLYVTVKSPELSTASPVLNKSVLATYPPFS